MAIRGESLQLGPWTGGVNFAVPAEDLTPNDIFDGQNVRIGVGGEVTKRGGSEPYNGSAISGSPTITALGEQRFSASSEKGFVIAGTKFFEDNLSGTLTDRTAAGTSITAGNDNTFQTVNANGTLIATNGVASDDIIKWTAAGGDTADLGGYTSRFSTAVAVDFFDNRLWFGNLTGSSGTTDRIWRSDTADIETYGANSFHRFGEEITAVKKIGNGLAVHTLNGIYLLVPTGNAATPYRQIQRANTGTISERSVVTVQIPNTGEVQLYIRRDGIYLFNGDSAQKISWKLDGARYWDTINGDRLHKSHAVVYPNRNEVWFFVPHGASQVTMNHHIVFDYVRQIFYPPFLGIARNSSGVINDVPHCGGLSDGYVYKHESTNIYDNDGSTSSGIDAFFETAAPSPMGTDVRLRWLFARTGYDVEGNDEVTIGYSSPGIVSEFTTFTQEGGFDAIETDFEIGSSAIAGEGSLSSVDTDLSGYDSNVKMRYGNANTSETFTIRRVMLVYKPVGRVRKEKAGIF